MIKELILYLLLILLFCIFIYLFFRELKEIITFQKNIFTKDSKEIYEKESIMSQKEYKFLITKYICLFLYLGFLISYVLNFLGIFNVFENSTMIFKDSNNSGFIFLFALIICKYIIEPRFK